MSVYRLLLPAEEYIFPMMIVSFGASEYAYRGTGGTFLAKVLIPGELGVDFVRKVFIP